MLYVAETLVPVPVLRDLDAPQLVDQLVGVLQYQFSVCVEQVIIAPKITLPKSCVQRSVLLVPQLSEELGLGPSDLSARLQATTSSRSKTFLGSR